MTDDHVSKMQLLESRIELDGFQFADNSALIAFPLGVIQILVDCFANSVKIFSERKIGILHQISHVYLKLD